MDVKNGQHAPHGEKKYSWQQTQHLWRFSSAKESDMLEVAKQLQPAISEVAAAHGPG